MIRPFRKHAFTLTEVMIALALIAFLMVGISKIFGMMSSTISAGQGVSRLLRTHKAIQQATSNDFLGYSSRGNIAKPDDHSGMAPLIVEPGQDGAAYLSISNFRIAAYASEKDWKSGINPPAAIVSPLNNAAHSLAVRTVEDANTGTRIIPLFETGYRNFRCDTIGFTARGDFRSQTGGIDTTGRTASYQVDVRSPYAFIWYGHMKTFIGEPTLIGDVDGFGAPGIWMIQDGTNTSLYRENKNARFANQWLLGRAQMLLVEPQDTEGGEPTATPPSGGWKTYQYFSVNDELGNPVPFIQRNWAAPDDTTSNTLTPINFGSVTFQHRPLGGTNKGKNDQVYGTGPNPGPAVPAFNDTFNSTTYTTPMSLGRTDIFGVGAKELRQRAEYLDGNVPTWRTNLPINWNNRTLCNPFLPAQDKDEDGEQKILFNARVMGQRQQLLAEGVSQFIVEFAGDFVTQSANGTPGAAVPDGVMDFSVDPNDSTIHATRWYGLPRDVDGNGVIAGAGNTNGMRQSPDVIPVRDFAGVALPFENVFTPTRANYLDASVAANVTEPNGATGTPNDPAYRCVWGPREFANATLVGGVNRYQVPQMIRMVVEVTDRKGESITQEYVYPVKVQ